MPRPPLRPLLGAAAAAVLILGVTVPAAAAGTGASSRHRDRTPIPGSHPAWATAARLVMPVTRGTVTVRVYLAGRDRRGLAAFAAAVSTPGSPDYRHFLTPARARAQFGPAAEQVAAVRSWLRAAGLAITRVSDAGVAGGFVAARGPVAAAGRAFGVTFGWYRGPRGHVYRAPSRTARVPARAAAAVLAVSGLTNAPGDLSPRWAPATGAAHQPPARCSRYYGQAVAARTPAAYGRHWPWAVCGYQPWQLRRAYNITPSGMSGAGQTVAIVDAYLSPTLLPDANRYARMTGDTSFAPGQYAQYPLGPFTRRHQCDATGWSVEQSLDVEAVHGLAPAARVRYVGAASCYDEDLSAALAFIVNHHLASIVSDSWGGLEEAAQLSAVYAAIFQAGAAEGIGFYFASGDAGYNAPGENHKSSRIQVGFPDSSPWVTSVGGTSLAIGPDGRYEWETGWGNLADPIARNGRAWRYPPPGRYPDGFAGAGGGGVSTLFPQPPYQQDVVPYSLATRLPDGRRSPAPMRVEPDVAAVANQFTGMLVGQTGPGHGFRLLRVGGTSLACPVFAAIQASAQQAAGEVFGFANPVIYRLYGTAAFHDVTDHPLGPVFLSLAGTRHEHASTGHGPIVTSLIAVGINGRGAAALRAVRGYDDATGVGSPGRYIQWFRP